MFIAAFSTASYNLSLFCSVLLDRECFLANRTSKFNVVGWSRALTFQRAIPSAAFISFNQRVGTRYGFIANGALNILIFIRRISSTFGRAVFIIRPSWHKGIIALSALLGLVFSSFGASIDIAARSASQRFSSCFGAAIDALLLVLGRRAKFSIVDFLMAFDAQRYSIVNIKRKVEIIGKRLDMVSVYVAFSTTRLTRIFVSLVNSDAPFNEFTFKLSSFAMRSLPAFPYRRRFAGLPTKQAFVRAKTSAVVDGIKLITACITGFEVGFPSIAPTFLGTPFGGFDSVLGNFELIAARFAEFNSGIVRGIIHVSLAPYKLVSMPPNDSSRCGGDSIGFTRVIIAQNV